MEYAVLDEQPVIEDDSGRAWLWSGMGWDLLIPSQADEAARLDAAEFARMCGELPPPPV